MGFIKNFAENTFGSTEAAGARRGGEVQAEAGEEAIGTIDESAARAQGFFSPFQGVGQRGIEQSEFLGDPQAQFDFLQNNPLFKLALQNANQQTQSGAAAGGRLSAGDTLQQLSNNVLLSASPLIDRQRQDILDQLGFGANIAGQQAGIETGRGLNVADLQTDVGAARAGGIVAQSALRGQRGRRIKKQAEKGFKFGKFFSDPRLKENKKIIGNEKGYNIWTWTWNKLAFDKFGLSGSSFGVMYDEVLKKNPEATIFKDGFGQVNYQMLGIQAGPQ